MRNHIEPFALQIFRRFKGGESIEVLSSCLGIPEHRVRQRIRVASLYHARQNGHSGATVRTAPPDGAFAS